LIGFFPNCATVVAPYITWLYMQEVKLQFSDFIFFILPIKLSAKLKINIFLMIVSFCV